LSESFSLGEVGSNNVDLVAVRTNPVMGLPHSAMHPRVAAIHPATLDETVATIRPLGNRRPPAEVVDAEGHLAGLRQLPAIVTWACIDIGGGKKADRFAGGERIDPLCAESDGGRSDSQHDRIVMG